jgi:hypothetical protein
MRRCGGAPVKLVSVSLEGRSPASAIGVSLGDRKNDRKTWV